MRISFEIEAKFERVFVGIRSTRANENKGRRVSTSRVPLAFSDSGKCPEQISLSINELLLFSYRRGISVYVSERMPI
jgi:hypothetical protein